VPVLAYSITGTPVFTGENKKILIIDNKQSSRLILRNILELFDFQVNELADKNMLATACRNSRPDIILLDWGKPTVDDSAVMEQLRYKDLNTIPVIAVVSADDTAEFAQEKFSDYVVKPFSSNDLLTVIAAQLSIPLTNE
ncbi:MAG: response regulator, partial [Candidatus Electrothrix sp. AR3]|nr:response regulator [Candidatus Electrothrix sp. AR3]